MKIKKPKKRLFKKSLTNPKVEKKKLVINSPSQTFFRRNEKDIFLVLIPLLLGLVFLIFLSINFKLREARLNINNNISLEHSILDYPIGNILQDPPLSAKSAIIIDQGTKKIIYDKNSVLRHSMASTAKIMTALVALDFYRSDSVITVISDGIEGSGVGLKVGEQYLFDDLLYAMMLPSANDAAVAIVDNYPGGRSAFVEKMNNKARELYLENTSFHDPAGLDDDGNFTTASDLARLGSIAVGNKKLSEVVNTKSRYVADIDKTRRYNLENLNRFLGYKGVYGIKTGTTEGAGEVLVTSTILNDHEFIIVVMNSADRFADTNLLLDLILENVNFVSLSLNE